MDELKAKIKENRKMRNIYQPVTDKPWRGFLHLPLEKGVRMKDEDVLATHFTDMYLDLHVPITDFLKKKASAEFQGQSFELTVLQGILDRQTLPLKSAIVVDWFTPEYPQTRRKVMVGVIFSVDPDTLEFTAFFPSSGMSWETFSEITGAPLQFFDRWNPGSTEASPV